MSQGSEFEIPSIFHGAKEYKDDPDALELGQATFNEEGLYQAIAGFAQEWYRAEVKAARILDVCCATGLCAARIADSIPVESISLVDSDSRALERAILRFAGRIPVEAHCIDSVVFSSTKPFDLILLNSAYHHIEDKRKASFLANIGNLLDHRGCVLVGENLLPNYSNDKSKKEAILVFYTALLAALKQCGETAEAINTIRRSGLHCWHGEYEYKVSWQRFLNDLRVSGSGLHVMKYKIVWSPSSNGDFGSTAVVLARR